MCFKMATFVHNHRQISDAASEQYAREQDIDASKTIARLQRSRGETVQVLLSHFWTGATWAKASHS